MRASNHMHTHQQAGSNYIDCWNNNKASIIDPCVLSVYEIQAKSSNQGEITTFLGDFEQKTEQESSINHYFFTEKWLMFLSLKQFHFHIGFRHKTIIKNELVEDNTSWLKYLEYILIT